MKELKQVLRCPVCSSEKSVPVYSKDNYTLKKCKVCEIIYLSPVLKDIKRIYLDDASSSTTSYYKLSEITDTEVFQKRLEVIEKYCSKENLLDIGSNIGTFLKTSKMRGWENVLGIEPNSVAAEFSKKSNIPVINDFYNHEIAKKYSEAFTAVNMGDVIEHMEKPLEILNEVYKVLKTGGVLIIITPDFESRTARFLQIKPEEHIFYFTKKNIANLLHKSGFKILQIKSGTRKRAFNALAYSTTFKSNTAIKTVKLISLLKLGIFFNFLLKLFVKDEIFVIAQK